MDTNLIYIFVFLYLICVFFTTFYCHLADTCCSKKRTYNIVSTHDENNVYRQVINVYEDEIENNNENENENHSK